MKKSVIIVIMLFISLILLAEDFTMPIMIENSGDDSVGRRLIYEIKEGIKESKSMKLSLINELGIKISIVTLEGNRDNPGDYTVYSISFLWNNPKQPFPYYLISSVGYCGSNRVEGVAKSIVAETYEQSEYILKLLLSLTKESKKE
jgi:hypothetical protein